MRHLRYVQATDCDNIFAWRNTPETRVYFRNSAALNYTDHCLWFGRAVADPTINYFVYEEEDGTACGVLRFDRNGNEADVSLYLVPGKSGRGLGSEMLKSGIEWMRDQKDGISVITAIVLHVNTASRNLFARAGFKLAGSDDAVLYYRLDLTVDEFKGTTK